jgi:Icc-related predicted phosphoesterase
MLMRCFSDLHTEFWNAKNLEEQLNLVVPHMHKDKETVAVIAGDLGLFHRPEVWLKVLGLLGKRFKSVIFVAGNHEFYNNDWIDNFNIRKISLPANVYLLENECCITTGIVFIGATLWTDFDNDEYVMRTAEKGMNDFRIIKHKDGSRFTPEQSVNMFNRSKKFIFNQIAIAKREGSKVIVITHHAPSPLSISPRFKGDILNGAFMSDLSDKILVNGPDLWIHGHVHSSHSYTIGDTQIIANPYGYKDVEVNTQYDPKLIIDL